MREREKSGLGEREKQRVCVFVGESVGDDRRVRESERKREEWVGREREREREERECVSLWERVLERQESERE